MGSQFGDLPGWEFTVTEQSAAVCRVVAVRDGGVAGQSAGVDPDAQIEELKLWARGVEADLRARND